MVTTEPKIIAIIPARGESESIAGLNGRRLAGKPLIAYAVEAARASRRVDRVIVTTNNREIADLAVAAGGEAPFLRDAGLSAESATTEAVLQHAVLWLDKNQSYHADIVVYLTPSSVFRQPSWVDDAIGRLLTDRTLDSAFVAHGTTKNFWRKQDATWVRLAPDIVYGPHHTREPLYREETPVVCATRADLIRQGRRVGPHVDLIITDDKRVTFHIQDEFDFWLAEQMMTKWPMNRALP